MTRTIARNKLTYRYYAYSPEMGRRRVPGDCITQPMAIDWAAGRGAINVVREDGPASKPHSVQLVWERDAKSTYDIQIEIANVLAERFPNATVREVGEATKALLALFESK